MNFRGDIDVSGAIAGLDRLAGEQLQSLARSMGVAGGQVLRDEAKLRAPRESGTLAESIYLAFKDGKSTEARAVYSVTWNSRKAPHGHLLEFGHWQPYQVVKINGQFVTLKDKPLENPKWIAAHPFLRPAFDSSSGRAVTAMQDRGRARLAELLAEGALDVD